MMKTQKRQSHVKVKKEIIEEVKETNENNDKIENKNIKKEEAGVEDSIQKQLFPIDKVGLYELILNQLLADGLVKNYELLKKSLCIEENKQMNKEYLYELYKKDLFQNKESSKEEQKTKLESLDKYLNLKETSWNEYILNYDIGKEPINKDYRYSIMDYVETKHDDICTCCAVNKNHTLLCSGGADNIIKVVKIKEKKKRKIYKMNHHTGSINCLQFHPFKNILFSASNDCTVKVTDMSQILKKRNKIIQPRWNRNERMRKNFRKIYPYDYGIRDEEYFEKSIVIEDKEPFTNLFIHPTGDFLYATNKNTCLIKLYDLETLQCFITLDTKHNHSYPITGINGSSDGSIYVSASKDGSIKYWDAITSKVIHTVPNAHSGYSVESVQFNKSNKYIITSGLDGQTKVWDLRNLKTVYTYGNAVSCVFNKSIFFNDEQYIANIIHTNEAIQNVYTSNDTSSFCDFYIYNSYFGNLEYKVTNVHHNLIQQIIPAKRNMSVHSASSDYLCKTIHLDKNYMK